MEMFFHEGYSFCVTYNVMATLLQVSTDLLFEPRHFNYYQKIYAALSYYAITITGLLKEEYFNFKINVDL